MQKSKKRLLKSLYSVCFSIFTVVVGLLFIVQTWSIFRSAEHGAFTVARISEHFNQIAVPVFFWVAALIVNIVLGYTIPEEKEKVKPYFESKERLARLEKRLPADSALRGYQNADAFNVVLGTFAVVFAYIAVLVSLFYLFASHYEFALTDRIFVENNSMADRLVRVLIWCGSAVMLLMAAVIFSEYFAKRKEEKIKKEIAENAKKGLVVLSPASKDGKEKEKGSNVGVWIVRAIVATIGIVFVVLGVNNGGMQAVLSKAVKICTQCIGLG